MQYYENINNFDPILSTEEITKDGKVDKVIQKYCNEILISDGIIIVHPNWWGQPPAILKGWVDRVIRPGVAYEFEETDGGEGVPIGLLKAQCAIVFNTSNTPSEREKNAFGDPLERLWNNCIFKLCGIKKFHRKMYNIVCISTLEERMAWLKDGMVKMEMSSHKHMEKFIRYKLFDLNEKDILKIIKVPKKNMALIIKIAWGLEWDINFEKEYIDKLLAIGVVKTIYYDDTFVGYFWFEEKEENDEIFINSMQLKKEFQSKGIGTQILKWLEGFAWDRNRQYLCYLFK